MSKKRSRIIDELTEIVLIAHGYDDEENETEWDPDNEDSQYSIVRDDIELIITTLEHNGLLEI